MTQAAFPRVLQAGAVEPAAQMTPLFLELVTAWPIGYRLEEKCSALGSFLGGGGAFHAMCAHHGCSDE